MPYWIICRRRRYAILTGNYQFKILMNLHRRQKAIRYIAMWTLAASRIKQARHSRHTRVIGTLAKMVSYIGTIHGLTTKQVIQNYYNPAFVNLQRNQFAGLSSSIEMAYVGVSNSQYAGSFLLSFSIVIMT